MPDNLGLILLANTYLKRKGKDFTIVDILETCERILQKIEKGREKDTEVSLKNSIGNLGDRYETT